MSNKLILLILVILVSTSAYASHPNYEVSIDLEDEIYAETDALGDIIITKLDYITETFAENNFSLIENMTMQNYDTFHWLGNEYIEMTKPNSNIVGLGTNEKYKFTSAGDYKFEKINENVSFYILVETEDPLLVEIDIDSDIDLDYLDEVAVSTQKVIPINITEDRLDVGIYELEINTFSHYNKTETHEFVFIENEEFLIGNSSLNNISIQSNTYENWGFLTIKNDGNLDFEVDTRITGPGAIFVNVQNTLQTFRGSNSVLTFILQIPLTQVDGTYPIQIELVSADKSIVLDRDIIVKDVTKPEFLNISFENDNLYVSNRFLVYTKDNIGVKSANVTYNNETYVLEKDQGYFSLETVFTNATEYSFDFCITDMSNNTLNEVVKKTFTELKLVEPNQFKNSVKIKINNFYKSTLFNFTHGIDVPINVTLKSLYFNDNISIDQYAIRLKNIEFGTLPFEGINSTIKITGSGEVFLEIRVNKPGKIDGKLEFNVPDGIEKPNDIDFEFVFVEYDPGASFAKEWYNDILDCTLVEEARYEDSYYECVTKHPLAMSEAELLVPVSIKEKELVDEQIRELKADKFKIIFGMVMLFMFMFLILVFLILGIIYYSKVKPKLLYIGGKK